MNKTHKTCRKCNRILPISEFYSIRTSYCKKCERKLCKDYDRRKKLKVFQKLSGDETPKCAVCGFSDDIRFLQIDHINDDGNRDLTSWGRRYKGNEMYRKIFKMSKEDAKEKYQVLCAFHNWAKRFGKTGEEYKVIVLGDRNEG